MFSDNFRGSQVSDFKVFLTAKSRSQLYKPTTTGIYKTGAMLHRDVSYR